MVLFDGGYALGTPINNTSYGFSLYYYNKDHLGNNREVVNYIGNVQQLTNYYPFGAPYTDPNAVMGSNVQQYKYNGKELVTMHGLNTYDYGARQYDPILCRWDRVDPLAEKYYAISPYAYCEYDPVNAIDPDGRNSLKLLLKGAYKVGKTVAKNGLSSLTKGATYTAAFNGVVDDAKTVFDSNASTWDRAVAGVSLISEIASPVSVKDAKNIGKAAKGLAKDYSKIGSTGKVGEEALKKLGGKSQQTFDTSQGKRIVDQFSEGVAHESKVGYQSLTKGIKSQIQKDAELMKTKEIDGATWHFFESPVTGKGGPSKPLMDELKKMTLKLKFMSSKLADFIVTCTILIYNNLKK
jgi:RHS repeat-associated protein